VISWIECSNMVKVIQFWTSLNDQFFVVKTPVLLVDPLNSNKSSDILTTILIQLLRQLCCSLFSWSKIIVSEKWRENKNIIWVWERKLCKSCTKMIVQISFLFQQQGVFTFYSGRKQQCISSFYVKCWRSRHSSKCFLHKKALRLW